MHKVQVVVVGPQRVRWIATNSTPQILDKLHTQVIGIGSKLHKAQDHSAQEESEVSCRVIEIY